MKTIVGLFDDRAQANTAASNLQAAGISSGDISFIANNEDRSYGTIADAPVQSDTLVHHTLKDAEWGVGIGGVLGTLAGASLFIVPGFGWIAGAGWLAGLLGGAALGGIVGGLVGALVHIGVPETDAAYYTEGVRRGGFLLTVRADESMANRVAQILDDAGAINIDERGAQYRSEGWTPSSYSNTSGMSTAYDNAPSGMTSSSPSMVDTTYRTRSYGYNDTPYTGMQHQPRMADAVEGRVPGIQTGGHALDGTPDTRGIMEKTADTLTGDNVDDKTGKAVR
jgi:hypothetical protein